MELVDHLGRPIRHSVRWPDEVKQLAAMNALDMTTRLEARKVRDTLDFIGRGGNPDLFVRIDVTLIEYRCVLARRFANGRVKTEIRLMRNSAAYIAQFTAQQIGTLLATTIDKATTIRNRPVSVRDILDPAMIGDEAIGDIDLPEVAG